jgi:CDP-paratose 2-epimerase
MEAVALAEKISGEPMVTEYHEDNRIGDHIWWVGSTAKFAAHYPAWSHTYDVPAILAEMYETNTKTWLRR